MRAIATITTLVARATPWLRQTTTIIGISGLPGVMVSVLLGEMTWAMALPLAVSAIVSMAMPGHPEASVVLTQVAVDAMAARNPATRAQALKALASDLPKSVDVLLTNKTETN